MAIRKKHFDIRGAVSILWMAIALPAAAQWNLDPTVRNPICRNDSNQSHPAMCRDGRGGAIIAWEDLFQNTTTPYIYVQRIDDRGVTLWHGNGFVLTTCIKDKQHAPVICSDGACGAIVAWFEDTAAIRGVRQIYAMHIDSNGNRTWECDGVKINNSSNATYLYNLFPDRNHGAYLVWGYANSLTNPTRSDIYVSRVDSGGDQKWTTPTTVVSDTGSLGLSGVTSGADTLGNVFVGWTDALKSGKGIVFRIQKVTSTGALGWIRSGLAPVDSSASLGAVTADNSGGAFMATCNSIVNGSNAKLIHVTPVGVFDFITTVLTGKCTIPAIISDGNNGAIGSWLYAFPSGKLSCARVDGKGKLLWAGNGIVSITDPNNIFIPGPQVLVSDGMRGAIAAWYELKPPSKDLYATHIDSAGKLFWGLTGKPVCTQSAVQEAIVGVDAFTDQVICAWVDYRDTATGTDIYAAKLGDPWLAAQDTIIDFGRVNVGDTSFKNVVLKNIGVEALSITGDNYIVLNNTEFELPNDTPTVQILYRDTVAVNTAFNPLSAGQKTFDLKYTSNTRFATPTIHLRGRGVIPLIATTPLVNFGTVVVNGSSALTLKQVIRSVGSGFLHVDSIRLAGTSGAFVIDSGDVAPVVLDSGMTLFMLVSFHPKIAGNIQDSVIVYNNSGDIGIVRLIGNGSKGLLVFTVSVLDFGTVAVGTPKEIVDTAIATSQKIVVISASLTSGGDFDQFGVIAGGGSFSVTTSTPHPLTLQFLPTSAGEKNSALLLYTATGDTYSLPVRGIGVAAVVHKPVLSPKALLVDFGDTLIGMRRDSTLENWISNTGDTTLRTTGMSITGPNASEFSVDDSTKQFGIEPGRGQSIVAHFAPLTPGTKTAYLSFTSNSETSPIVELHGRGVGPVVRGILSVASNTFDCGSSRVGKAKTINAFGFVHNTGTGPLVIENITLGGTDAGEYQITSPQPFSIDVGDSATISIVFTPIGTGIRTATLMIHTDIGDSAEIALTGTGTLAKIALMYPQIDFGNVPLLVLRDTAITTFVINIGTDTALVTNTSLASNVDNAFVLVAPGGAFTLAPQESSRVEITFLPTHTGVQNATLLVESGGDTSHTALMGRGVRQLALTIGSAHGTPGTVVVLPITADSSLAGTSVTGIDFSLLFSPRELFPQRILSQGTSSEGWNFDLPQIRGDTAIIHGTGGAPLRLGRHVCDLEGMILQSNIVQAPLSIIKPFPTGDSDVTMIVEAAGVITMDTLCGYRTQSFSSTTAALFVWQPTPNPATGMVHVPYRLGVRSSVSATVRDEQGRIISTHVVSELSAGDYSVMVDTHGFAPGMYFLTVSAGSASESRKIIVAR